MSRPYAEVIGDPISHSKSPLIHNFWLEKGGIDAEYRACHVLPAELADYLAQRREDADWRGCNVTIPHKQAAARLADEVECRAKGVGAVNTLVKLADGRLIGTNTDVDGIGEAIAMADLQDRKAVIIGGGGAARAAFAYLSDARCASVIVLARSPDKALRALQDCNLAADVVPFAPGPDTLKGASLLINATQLGMTGQDSMPDFVLQELARMDAGGLVFDMVYAPLETRLLTAARELGLRTADGLVMLVGQAATAFERFFGCAPPRDQDEVLRRILTR